MYVDVYYISTGIYRNKMVSAPLNWCYQQVLGTKWRGQWQHLSTSHLFPATSNYPVLNTLCTPADAVYPS